MKSYRKKIGAGVLGSIGVGLVGLLLGSMAFANSDFVFMGNRGYEAGGLLFAIIGFLLGGVLGVMMADHSSKNRVINLLLGIVTGAGTMLALKVILALLPARY